MGKRLTKLAVHWVSSGAQKPEEKAQLSYLFRFTVETQAVFRICPHNNQISTDVKFGTTSGKHASRYVPR
jgi:hypothetical protein